MNHHIPTNPDKDSVCGRNGIAKLKAISIWGSDSIIYIDGITTRNMTAQGAGFAIERNLGVLRLLAAAFQDLVTESEVDQAFERDLAKKIEKRCAKGYKPAKGIFYSDDDLVGEWVGRRYKVNFEACAEGKKDVWRERFGSLHDDTAPVA